MDLKTIIEKYALDERTIALMLFPDNKRPTSALKRVKDGLALLNTEQFAKLASYIGVTMDQLNKNGWASKPAQSNEIRLVHGDYEAILDKENLETRVFHKGTLFHEEIHPTPAMKLSDFITNLDEIIKNR